MPRPRQKKEIIFSVSTRYNIFQSHPMALEAVGLASSIAGLAVAAAAAFRASESMYNLVERVHAVKDDIQAFAMDIATYATVIKTAHFSLERHTKTLVRQSRVLQYLEEKNVLSQLDTYSRRVTLRIARLEGPIASLATSIPIWLQIKWMMQKREIDALSPLMLKIGNHLDTILLVVSLEVAYQRGDSNEIAELKREIKLHLKTIEVLQERQKRNSQASEELQKFIDSSDMIDNIRDVMVELCQNMLDQGAVPTDRSRRRGRGLDSPSTAPGSSKS